MDKCITAAKWSKALAGAHVIPIRQDQRGLSV
jgi:hypothetical protein